MGETTAGMLDTILANVQEEVSDSELSFKLRTARQLIVLCGEEQKAYKEALAEVDLDPEVLENLRQLGYLD